MNPARAVIAASMTVFLAGCGSVAASEPKRPATFDVAGTMQLTDANGVLSGSYDCVGHGGYTDMSSGAQVTIRDDTGKPIALGSLGMGTTTDTGGCEFPFVVEGVKAEGDIFSVEVASRGEVQFERANAGNVALTLG